LQPGSGDRQGCLSYLADDCNAGRPAKTVGVCEWRADGLPPPDSHQASGVVGEDHAVRIPRSTSETGRPVANGLRMPDGSFSFAEFSAAIKRHTNRQDRCAADSPVLCVPTDGLQPLFAVLGRAAALQREWGGCLRLSGCHWYPSRRRRRQPPDGVHHQSLCCGRSNHPLSGSAGMEFALVVEMPPCRFHTAHEFVAIKRLRQYVPRP
jgi:hypothetical protein